MELPHDFIGTIQNTYGEPGFTFLNQLSDLINEASRRWGITDIQIAPNLSYNYVAFAHRRSSESNQVEEVVLKIGVLNRELASELKALRVFNGRGTVHLLEADEDQGMFLLERLRPGEMLASLKDDEKATHIAAEMMLKLWKPAPSDGSFINLSDWFKGFERLRKRYEGKTGPLDNDLVEMAEGTVKEFFSEDFQPMLIHGDLHHFNILSSDRGWVAIDPKGVIGPAAYEVGPLLINQVGDLHNNADNRRLFNKRIAILSERLGFERERIRKWGLAHAVLSAWWSLEDKASWESAIACARILLEEEN